MRTVTEAVDKMLGMRLSSSATLDETSLQTWQYGVVEQYIGQATTTEGLATAVDVYAAFRSNMPDIKAPVGPASFTKQVIRQATAVSYDSHEGTAVPDAVAEFALPAMRRFAAEPSLRMYNDHENQIEKGVGSFPYGTADYLAGSQVVTRLREQPGTRFAPASLPVGPARGTEPHITESALRYLRSKGIISEIQLPNRTPAMAAIGQIMLGTLQEAAKEGNDNASKLIKAYRDLSVHDFQNGRPRSPLTVTTLAIANAIKSQVEDRVVEKGHKFLSLERFNNDELDRLPQAFGRLLFMVDPKLLNTAVNSPLHNGEPLRLRMVYLEALSQSWLNYRRDRSTRIGDLVLNHIAGGKEPDDISALMLAHAHPAPVRAVQRGKRARL